MCWFFCFQNISFEWIWKDFKKLNAQYVNILNSMTTLQFIQSALPLQRGMSNSSRNDNDCPAFLLCGEKTYRHYWKEYAKKRSVNYVTLQRTQDEFVTHWLAKLQLAQLLDDSWGFLDNHCCNKFILRSL